MVCFVAACFYLYEYAIQVMPSALTNQMMASLGIGANVFASMLSLFYLGYTPMQIPAGLLFDRFSPKIILTSCIFVCGLSTILFGLSNNLIVLSIARFLTGASASFAFIGTLVLATRWFEAKYFALIVGLVQLLGAMGAIFGEVPVAIAAKHIHWQQIFIITGLIGIVLALCVYWIIDDKKAPIKIQVDTGKQGQWQRLRQVIRIKQNWWTACYAFTTWAPITTFAVLWVIPYLMVSQHATNTQAASSAAIIWIGIGLGSPLFGWWSNHIKQRKLPSIICSILALVGMSLILYDNHTSTLLLNCYLFIFGVGASGQILSFSLIQDNNPKHITGTAVGFNNMAVLLGGLFLQPLSGIILNHFWSGQYHLGAPAYSIYDYRLALGILPLISLAGVMISSFLIKETHCKHVS